MNKQDLINAIRTMPLDELIEFVSSWIDSDLTTFGDITTSDLVNSLRKFCKDNYKQDSDLN